MSPHIRVQIGVFLPEVRRSGSNKIFLDIAGKLCGSSARLMLYRGETRARFTGANRGDRVRSARNYLYVDRWEMLQGASSCGSQEMLSEALEQLRSALQLLDSASAPSHIGAHVDLAIHELYSAVAGISAGPALTQTDRNVQPH
jgi:hypothetical protein